MALPLVSIIVPNFNDSEYIGHTIESILSQTYSNIELIIIDDGSTDNSIAIIKKYRDDKRLRLVERRENRGTIYSLNEGIAYAQGEYINFFSANDFFFPTFISQCLEQLVHHLDIGMCCTDLMAFMVESNTYCSTRYIPSATRPLRVGVNEIAKTFRNSFLKLSGNTSILRTDLVRREGGLKSELYCSCDWYLITKIAFAAGLIYIPEPLVCWRKLSNCYTERMLKDKSIVKKMYGYLLDDLLREDQQTQLQFERSGELACVVKFAPFEILKRPKFLLSAVIGIMRYLRRKIRKILLSA